MSSLLNNRHRKTRPLGSGGFSQTFLGEDTHFKRPCVIKQLKPAHDPEVYELYQRFQSESKILKKLGEINGQIPDCYDVFSENGNFYLVQEWIDGKSFDEKLRAGEAFSESEVKTLLCSLLSVLDVVHFFPPSIPPGLTLYSDTNTRSRFCF